MAITWTAVAPTFNVDIETRRGIDDDKQLLGDTVYSQDSWR